MAAIKRIICNGALETKNNRTSGRLCIALLCLMLISLLFFSVSAVSSVPRPVIEATESVVRVLAEYPDGYATGSGFVIKSDKEETLIATNYHVVEGKPHSISVWLGEEETVSATILTYTNQKDMCILKLAYPVSLKPLAFSVNGAKQGEAVYAVGFPGAADYLSDKEAHTSADATITDGIVSAVREATVSSYGTPTKILQINAAINSGNSGGPLFNIDGEVVGINTYGISDSQGIFGAIDVIELKAFMADHSIQIPKVENSFPWWIVIVTATAIIAVVFVIVIMRKKKMKSTQKIEVKHVSLCEYMAGNSDGLGVQNAVAMLLPVALQLRDMHNNGSAHLEVSPNSIFIGENGAFLRSTTFSEANRYTSGFAAPEIYKGASAGNLSDIYSFCAVLSYVVSGKMPENSLLRTDNEGDSVISEGAENPFAEMLKMGMALDPTNRIASMQEIILQLSPYNVRPFISATVTTSQATPTKAKKLKRRISTKKLVAVVAVVLAVIFIGTYFGCYLGARSNAKNGDFETADKLLFIPPITKLHDRKLSEYISAGKKLDSRQYSDAKNAFAGLPGYLNADELALEADYRYAIQCADANNFSTAISTMTSLSLSKYKDSCDKLLEFQYRHGVYLLFEESNFSEAEKIFSQLAQKKYAGAEDMKKETQYLWAVSLIEDEDYIAAYTKLTIIKNYSDVKDILAALEEVIYAEGQNLYYNEEYLKAQIYFLTIPSYRDSEKYLTLINIHRFGAYPNAEDAVNKLLQIFYFEDASELLLSNQKIGEQFLLGTWRGNGYEFTMEEDGHIEYDLPWFDYGDYYRIEDGKILLYPKNDESKTKTLYDFSAISPDCMEVYCYKNGKTYTLYRH